MLVSVLPVARASMQMHHRQNVDAVALDGIEDAVREAVNKTAANVALQDRPGTRMRYDAPDRREDVQRELLTECRLNAIIEVHRLLEFCFGFRMEVEGHRATRALIRART